MSLNVYLYREDIPVGMRVVTMNDACDIIYNKKHYSFLDDFIVAIATDRRTCRITEEDLERIFAEESGKE